MLFEDTEVRMQAAPMRFDVEPNLHLLHRIDKLIAANDKHLECPVLSQVPLVAKEVLSKHDRLHFVLRSLTRLTNDLTKDKIKGLPKRQFTIHTLVQALNSLFQKIPMNKPSQLQVSYSGLIKLLVEDYRPLFTFFCSQYHQTIKTYVDRNLETLGHLRHPSTATDCQQTDDTLDILAGFLKGKSQSVYERTKTFFNIDPIEQIIGSIDFRNYGNLDDLLSSCESNISLISSTVISFQSHQSLPLTASELFILTCILCRLKNLLGVCKQTNEFEIALAENREEEKRKADALEHIARSIRSLDDSLRQTHGGQVTPALVREMMESLAVMESSERFRGFSVSFILEVVKHITPSTAHKRHLLAGLLPLIKLGDHKSEIALFTKNEVFTQLISNLDQSSPSTGEYEDKPFVDFLLSTAAHGSGLSLAGFLIEKIRKTTIEVFQSRWSVFERYLDLFLAHCGVSFGVEEALQVLTSTSKLWVWTELSLKFAAQLFSKDYASLKKSFNLSIHPSKLSSRLHVVKKVNEEVIRTTYSASIRMPRIEKRLDYLDIVLFKLLSVYPKHLATIEDYYRCFQQRLSSSSTTGHKPQDLESVQLRLTFHSMFFKGLNKVLSTELAVVNPEEFKKQLTEVQRVCRAYDIDFETSFTGSTVKKCSQISALADESISKAISAVTSASNCFSLLEAMSLSEQPQQIQSLTKEILEKLVALQKLKTPQICSPSDTN